MINNQDNHNSKPKSNYGTLDQTNPATNEDDQTSSQKEVVESGQVGQPPAPALRRKTLEKRLNNQNQLSQKVDENQLNESQHNKQIDRENIHRRSHIAPPNLSMSQLRQQQAINKELTERHKSLRRISNQDKDKHEDINNKNNEDTTSTKHQGFQNAAFQDEPTTKPQVEQQQQQDTSQQTNHLPSSAKDYQSLKSNNDPIIVAKNIDENPLNLLIKRNQQDDRDPKNGKTILSIEPLSNSKKGLEKQVDTNGNKNNVDDDDGEDEDARAEKELQDIDESQLRPYPRKVFCIVANEFCERFSYYGLRTVLVLYFKSVLGMSDSQSTVNFHIFAALCYLTPIFGAILGDSVWGKFKTILYLSVVYFLGEFILVASSIYWHSGSLSDWTTLIGLLLIGIGTGGIKPCVSAFGGDQFLPNETRRRASFFSMFYASINAGSLISMFVTPMLRSDFQCVGRVDCYPLAFGLPCILMFMSIVCFLLAKNHYTYHELPEKNVILAFIQCVWLAAKRKLSGWKQTDLAPLERSISTALTDSQSSLESATTKSSYGLTGSTGAIGPKEATNAKINDVQSTSRRSSGTSESRRMSRIRRQQQQQQRRNHWIYLARDQFDAKSMEDFRSVLGILLLFVPIPVYWCLYDQQGSLWTLQAARMDGRIFGSDFILQPDQVAVANPILLLATIPLFQCFIYPTLNKYNLLRSSVSKITLGGFMAALTFAVSAFIQFRIQSAMPPMAPPTGQASINLVNGLSNCRLIELELTHNHAIGDGSSLVSKVATAAAAAAPANKTSDAPSDFRFANQTHLAPLTGQLIAVKSRQSYSTLNNYRIRFRVASGLSSSSLTSNPTTSTTSNSKIDLTTSPNSNNDDKDGHSATTTTSSTPHPTTRQNCALDSSLRHELNVAPFEDEAKQLVYIEQGNGKLKYNVFNESWDLPEAHLARVVLLYESFGPSSSSSKRRFRLVPANKLHNDKPRPNSGMKNESPSPSKADWVLDNEELHHQNSNRSTNGGIDDVSGAKKKLGWRKYQFEKLEARLGSVYMYHWVDFEVPPRGLEFKLQTSLLGQQHHSNNNNNNISDSLPISQHQLKLIKLSPPEVVDEDRREDIKLQIIDFNDAISDTISLKPGTRNMIIVHQATSNEAYFRHSITQDDTYRINILWQLIPYLMISMSEVLFSITGLEFSYSVAPDTMKSVILGAWFLTNAVGNILTVAVEAIHPFSNVAYDFLFYAALMVVDMILFMYIGLRFKPYNRRNV